MRVGAVQLFAGSKAVLHLQFIHHTRGLNGEGSIVMKHFRPQRLWLIGLSASFVLAVSGCDSVHPNGDLGMHLGTAQAAQEQTESEHVQSIRMMQANVLRSPEELDWIEALNVR
jgi:hypothetical protein